MYLPEFTNSFKKDFKIAEKRNRDIQSLEDIIKKLIAGQSLASKSKNHPLKGKYTGFMECHIENDWLLIYKIFDNKIFFTRTGTHSDLFK